MRKTNTTGGHSKSNCSPNTEQTAFGHYVQGVSIAMPGMVWVVKLIKGDHEVFSVVSVVSVIRGDKCGH